MKKQFLAVVLLLAAGCWGYAEEEESPSGIRIAREENGDSVTLRVQSKYTSEFTLTLEAVLDNVKPSQPLPLTVDSAGRRSFVLIRLDRIDKSRRWSYRYQPYCVYGARRSTTTNDADYALPFGPGRYVVMQGPGGSVGVIYSDYFLAGGTLSIGGGLTLNAAHFDQIGGTNSIAGTLLIGPIPPSQSTGYALNGGTLNVHDIEIPD